jgi:hypothetical protein
VISQPQTDTYIALTSTVSELQTVFLTRLIRDTGASGTALEFYEASEQIVLIDETTQTTSNQFYKLTRIERSIEDAESSVKIYDPTGSKTLSRIAADESSPVFRQIEFLVPPAAGTAFRVEYWLKPDFLDDEQAAIFPGFDLDFIKWRAVGDLHWFKSEAQAAQLAWRKADGILDAHLNSELGQGSKSKTLQPDWRYRAMEGKRRRYRGGW